LPERCAAESVEKRGGSQAPGRGPGGKKPDDNMSKLGRDFRKNRRKGASEPVVGKGERGAIFQKSKKEGKNGHNPKALLKALVGKKKKGVNWGPRQNVLEETRGTKNNCSLKAQALSNRIWKPA